MNLFKNPNRFYFLYLFLSILGIFFLSRHLLPNNYIIAGHDSGLAINSGEFLGSRLFAWSPQGFGVDNSTHFGSLIIHGYDYLCSLISGISGAGNWFSLFFWLSVVFICAFIFAFSLREKLGKYFVYFFPVFIVFNFFIFQSLFILERAKYSVLAALLLLITVYFKIKNDNFSALKGGIIISFVFLIFNSGSWLGLPLYGGVFVTVGCILLYELFAFIKTKNFTDLKHTLAFFVVVGFGFVILNSYSIFPYLNTFIKNDLGVFTSGDAAVRGLSWLRSLSQASSFFNFFRLEGVPDWYAGADGINMAHSYASDYLTSPVLIIASLVFPIIMFLSLSFAKDKNEKRILSFFGLVIVFSMAFMAGSHPPLGRIYEIIYKYLPGFSIFRSPYYKFGSAYFIGVSVLLSFGFSKIVAKFEVKNRYFTKLIRVLIVLLILAFWLWFYRVIFNPETIFHWQQDLTTRLQVPEYVTDFGRDVETKVPGDQRILLVPGVNQIWKNDAYTWGYWSLTNLPSIVSNKSFVINEDIPLEEKAWLDKLYLLLSDGAEDDFLDICSKLDIGYVLLRKDVLSENSWSSLDGFDKYEKSLDNFSSIKKIGAYDKWILYDLDTPIQKFMPISSVIQIPKNDFYLATNFFGKDHTVFSGDIAPSSSYRNFINSDFFVKSCDSCNLNEVLENFSLSVSITPDSLLYILKIAREKRTLERAGSDENKVSAYLGFTLRRAAETRRMWDYGINDKYIVKNLQTMSTYLENIYAIIQKTSDPNTDFFSARHFSQYLDSIQGTIKPIYDNLDNLSRERTPIVTAYIDTIWNVTQIRNYYEPIIGDIYSWNTKKLFKVNLENDLTINMIKDSFPLALDGTYLFPQAVGFSDGKEYKLNFFEEGSFISFKLPEGYLGEQMLNFTFPESPNLYKSTGKSVENLLTGKTACLTGEIQNFRPSFDYLISVSVKDVNQKIMLYIKDLALTGNKKSFLRGDQEANLYPLYKTAPYRYYYRPSRSANGSKFYLCGTSKDLPEIEKIQVVEMFSPSLVFESEGNSYVDDNLPKISYSKINPTKYVVDVLGATDPYILKFNETFNDFWKAEIDGATIADDTHLKIDGYANSWIIDRKGNYQIVVEYMPQPLFKKGAIVTASGAIVFLVIFVFISRKKRYENE